jgi:hypothetical protein
MFISILKSFGLLRCARNDDDSVIIIIEAA